LTTWHQIRDHAIAAFGGETPNAQTEDLCITAFEEQPAWFLGTIETIELDYGNGNIRSGWGILRRRVIDNAKQRNPSVDTSTDRADLIKRAERWIHNAGLYVPDETELLDALFGPHGNLRPYASDERLRHRMVELWQANQPRAEQANRENLERAARYRAGKQPEEIFT